MNKPTKTRFEAACRMSEDKPFEQLTDAEHDWAQENGVNARYDRSKGYVVPISCDLKTEDPGLFEAHMKQEHGRTPIGWIERTRTSGWRYKKPKRWSGPKLLDEGRPFEPKALEPGATVTWKQLVETGEDYYDDDLHRRVPVRDWAERSGQVWSLAAYPKSAWVVPFELFEGELAVCVHQDGTALYVRATQRTHTPTAEMALS